MEATMKKGFYQKIALTGITKNKKLYIPYILTCVGMVMMLYIITFLSDTPLLHNMRGGDTAGVMLGFGSRVIAVFSVIFLFYTNSFLIRRRKKEFGLYNILGMGKKNIGIVMLWETLITAFIALAAGLFFGIIFSKFAELILLNILKADITFHLSVSLHAVKFTVLLFCGIFAAICLNSLRQIHFSNPIALLHSENSGEKPPKANILLGFLGVILLAYAYYLAVTIKEPLSALTLFFAAVILVIIGTYMLFISGSVLLCRLLQKKKGYYYKANHFISVSSMKYRMKRNGAGLATICILSTMVLVMLASTACLYFGEDELLNTRYPYDMDISVSFDSLTSASDENIGEQRQLINETAEANGILPRNIIDFVYAYIVGYMTEDTMETNYEAMQNFSMNTYDRLYQVYFVSVDDYNRLMSADEQLEPDEAMIFTVRCDYRYDTFTIKDGVTFNIVKEVDEFFESGNMDTAILPSMVIIVPELSETLEPLTRLTDSNDDHMLWIYWQYYFDTQAENDNQIKTADDIQDALRDYEIRSSGNGIERCTVESRAANKNDFINTFGGLFFLGIMLSIVFIAATVLIIYYKQISEGYEDQARFEIMQKVGMTKRDIRKSINSQMLTVFFLPLAAAVAHLCFAFPMINKLLMLFNLRDTKLFLTTTGISVLIFVLFYTLVYRITSNAYYSIVSGAREE